jgi:hypothetical protein
MSVSLDGYEGDLDGRVLVHNAMGVWVLQEEVKASSAAKGFSMDVSHLETGLYTLIFQKNGMTISRPFLISR